MNQYLNQLFSYGVQALQNSDLTIAQKTFLQILRDSPGHPDALNLLGVVFSKQGLHEKAISQFTRAIEKSPVNPNYYLNRGIAYSKNGEHTTAIVDLEKAVHLNPEFAEAFFNLGNIEKTIGHFEDAKRDLERALSIQPKHGQALYNLGNLHLEAGNYKTAIGFFERAVQVAPNLGIAHNNLAIALQEWERWDEAESHFKTALDLDPDSEARRNLALLYEIRGRTDEARELSLVFSKVKQDPWHTFHAEIICPVIPQSNEEIDHYRKKLIAVLDHYIKDPPPGGPEVICQRGAEPPSNLIYQGRDDSPVKQKFAELFKHYFPNPENLRASGNKVKRIGFVVTRGHEGVFLKCMSGIIQHLSRQKFNISVICSLPNGEKILRPGMGAAPVEYLSITNSLMQAADRIRLVGFDLLYYWEVGTDSLNYFLPFLRLAPVQCTSWGWPVTSGIPSMDYFISSRGLEVAEEQSPYTEKLAMLNRLPTYYYVPPVPERLPDRSHYGIRDEAHLYLCNQNLRKVHPDFDSLVADILLGDKAGMIVFIQDKQENITSLFKNRILNRYPEITNRLLVLKRMEEKEYLGLIGCADVILDTIHYTGGANTTYDAFAACTPVVTLPGILHRGRFTSAAYQQIGVMDYVASSRNDYVKKALELGTDRNFRDQTANRIRLASHQAFEDMVAVRELEQFFENVHLPS